MLRPHRQGSVSSPAAARAATRALYTAPAPSFCALLLWNRMCYSQLALNALFAWIAVRTWCRWP